MSKLENSLYLEPKKEKISTGKIILRSILCLIVVASLISMVIPFLWILTTSFKTYQQAMKWPPQWIPQPFLLESYVTVLAIPNFMRFLLNSAIYAIVGTLGVALFSAMSGFAFAKYHFPGRDFIFAIVLATIMIPMQVTLIPVFLIIKNLGWMNTFMGLIIPNLASAFGIFLIRQFALGIPDELMDAARIDGCGEFRIFRQIFLPLCIPALSTVVVLEFLWRWNDLFWPLIITRTEDMRTIQVALTIVCRSLYDVLWNQLAAGVILSFLPVFLLFVFFQRYFIKGIALSGLKG